MQSYDGVMRARTGLMLVVLVCLGGCVAPGGRRDRVAAGGPNILIVLDSSGSMRHNDPKSLRKEAAQFIVALTSRDENVSVVAFSSGARVVSSLRRADSPGAKRLVQSKIEDLKPEGATNFLAALKYSDRQIARNPGGPTNVIFLSDGRNNIGGTDDEVLAFVSERFAGKPVHAVAFTADANTKLLTEMAVRTGGTYRVVTKAEELVTVFETIARNFWPYIRIDGADAAAVFPGADKIVFVAKRSKGARAIREVTLAGNALPAMLRKTAYTFPARTLSGRKTLEIWSLDDPPQGRYQAQLAPGGEIRCVMERLPFRATFLAAQPADAYPLEEGRRIEIALHIEARNTEILTNLHDTMKATAQVGRVEVDGADKTLDRTFDTHDIERDQDGRSSYLLTTQVPVTEFAEDVVEFDDVVTEKPINVIVTLELRQRTADGKEVVWRKELKRTVIIHLPRPMIEIGVPR